MHKEKKKDQLSASDQLSDSKKPHSNHFQITDSKKAVLNK
jgi:hypothetical protein